MSLYLQVALIALAAACIRYLLMTGTYYVVVCKIFDTTFRKYKIDPAEVPVEAMRSEMTWALLNNINYAVLAAAA